MDYNDPACAYCPSTVRAWRQGDAEDRVPGHNPVAAMQLADSDYSRVWGPAKPPKLPVQGRRTG